MVEFCKLEHEFLRDMTDAYAENFPLILGSPKRAGEEWFSGAFKYYKWPTTRKVAVPWL